MSTTSWDHSNVNGQHIWLHFPSNADQADTNVSFTFVIARAPKYPSCLSHCSALSLLLHLPPPANFQFLSLSLPSPSHYSCASSLGWPNLVPRLVKDPAGTELGAVSDPIHKLQICFHLKNKNKSLAFKAGRQCLQTGWAFQGAERFNSLHSSFFPSQPVMNY